jgi:hypothetical protein
MSRNVHVFCREGRERARALVLGLVDNTKATRPKNRKEVGAFSVMVCDFLFLFLSKQIKLNGCLYI